MKIRLALVLAAAVASLSVGACAAPSADDAEASEDDITASGPRVLAIGDSITFAWDPTLERDPAKVDASRYHGFADLVAERLGAKADNAACPGETSSHFVDASGEDNGCAKNRATYKLHVDWHEATQLEFVTDYLAKNKPSLITLTLGGNDLLRVQANCELPSVLGAGCELVRLPFYEHAYGEHLETILRTIHRAGYRGKMAVVTIYAPDYSDKIANFGLGRINGEIRESIDHVRGDIPGMDVRVADGFEAFRAQADAHGGKTCETGLLIKNADGKTCDIHPTKAGHEILAQAILDAIR